MLLRGPPPPPPRQTTGPSNPNLHFECFDKRTDPKLFKNQWALVRILRNKIFIDECSVPEDQEFDLQEENSRHVLGLGMWGEAAAAAESIRLRAWSNP